MNKLLIFLLLVIPVSSWAQPGITPVVEKDGKRYYEHHVESGNTLYGLQRMYGVSVEEIVATNPELKNGLKIDQKVLIPITQSSIQKIPTSEYKVRKSETLYGLSKKFNVSIDDLVALNPELKDGLKRGQIIKVPSSALNSEEVVQVDPPVETSTPNPFVIDTVENVDGSADQVSFTFSDSTVRHVVMSHETLYSVSKRFMVPVDEIMRKNGLTSTTIREGQILVIPVKQERIERVEIRPVPLDYDPNGEGPLDFEKKNHYKVTVMLPFHLEVGPKYSRRVSDLSTQFYMGARLALDSLERKGFKADIQFLDTKNDSARVAKFLADTSLLSTDLIIGPLFKSNVEMVAAYCKENRIRMVCPVATERECIEGNRLVYEAVPSDEVIMNRLAEHMLENNARDHIVLVKPVVESDLKMYEAFKDRFNTADIEPATRPQLVETTIGGFMGTIRRGVNTIFVFPTNDRTTAMKFMNALNKSAFRSRPKNLFVYGTKDWVNYTDINSMYRNKYNFHFPSPNFIDYYTDEMKALNKQHRSWYKTDLSKMAVHGYDVMTYFCSNFFMDNENPFLMMSVFDMQQLSPKDGYENMDIFVVQQDEYELFNSEVERDDD